MRCISVAIAVGVVLTSACDRAVYAEDELRAQDRFQSIEVGRTEVSLIQVLGPPLGIATRTESGLLFEDHSGTSLRTVALSDDESSTWPPLLRYMPRRRSAGRVMIYSDATVTAYYFIDAEGRVEYVSVYTT